MPVRKPQSQSQSRFQTEQKPGKLAALRSQDSSSMVGSVGVVQPKQTPFPSHPVPLHQHHPIHPIPQLRPTHFTRHAQAEGNRKPAAGLARFFPETFGLISARKTGRKRSLPRVRRTQSCRERDAQDVGALYTQSPTLYGRDDR